MMLKILNYRTKKVHGEIYGIAACHCGKEFETIIRNVVRGYTHSCGCSRRKDPKKCVIPVRSELIYLKPHTELESIFFCKRCQKESALGNSRAFGGQITCGCANNSKPIVVPEGSRWKYIRDSGADADGKRLSEFECSCGQIRKVSNRAVSLGQSLSCGCYSREVASILSKSRAIPQKTAQGSAWAKFLYTAKKRNRPQEVQMPREQWLHLTQLHCHYCGSPPSNRVRARTGVGDFICNGIDRVDNDKGYTVENSVPCCYKCNSFKSNFTKNDFLAHINQIYSYKLVE